LGRSILRRVSRPRGVAFRLDRLGLLGELLVVEPGEGRLALDRVELAADELSDRSTGSGVGRDLGSGLAV
jgi:hypothetical protein